MAIAIVTTTNTFFEWMTVTNQLSGYVNLDVGGFGFSQANQAFARANTDYGFGQANQAFARANTDYGFGQANLAFSQANTALARANIDYGFGQANIAFNQANLAFARANIDYGFVQANIAFVRANTANITADVAFGQANQAFAKANAANVLAFNALANTTGAVFNGNLIISQNLTTGFSASNSNTTVVRLATGSEFRSGSSRSLALGVADTWDAAAEVSVADATTITLDFATGFNFNVNLTSKSTRTISTPSNMKPGQGGYIRLRQGGPTAQTIGTFGAGWNFAGGIAPTLSTGTGNTDLLFYQVLSTANVYGSLIKDIRLNY